MDLLSYQASLLSFRRILPNVRPLVINFNLLTTRPTLQNYHPLDLGRWVSQVTGNRAQVHCIAVNGKKVTTTPALQFKPTIGDGVEEDRGGGIHQKWRKVVTALCKSLHRRGTMEAPLAV